MAKWENVGFTFDSSLMSNALAQMANANNQISNAIGSRLDNLSAQALRVGEEQDNLKRTYVSNKLLAELNQIDPASAGARSKINALINRDANIEPWYKHSDVINKAIEAKLGTVSQLEEAKREHQRGLQRIGAQNAGSIALAKLNHQNALELEKYKQDIWKDQRAVLESYTIQHHNQETFDKMLDTATKAGFDNPGQIAADAHLAYAVRSDEARLGGVDPNKINSGDQELFRKYSEDPNNPSNEAALQKRLAELNMTKEQWAESAGRLYKAYKTADLYSKASDTEKYKQETQFTVGKDKLSQLILDQTSNKDATPESIATAVVKQATSDYKSLTGIQSKNVLISSDAKIQQLNKKVVELKNAEDLVTAKNGRLNTADLDKKVTELKQAVAEVENSSLKGTPEVDKQLAEIKAKISTLESYSNSEAAKLFEHVSTTKDRRSLSRLRVGSTIKVSSSFSDTAALTDEVETAFKNASKALGVDIPTTTTRGTYGNSSAFAFGGTSYNGGTTFSGVPSVLQNPPQGASQPAQGNQQQPQPNQPVQQSQSQSQPQARSQAQPQGQSQPQPQTAAQKRAERFANAGIEPIVTDGSADQDEEEGTDTPANDQPVSDATTTTTNTPATEPEQPEDKPAEDATEPAGETTTETDTTTKESDQESSSTDNNDTVSDAPDTATEGDQPATEDEAKTEEKSAEPAPEPEPKVPLTPEQKFKKEVETNYTEKATSGDGSSTVTYANVDPNSADALKLVHVAGGVDKKPEDVQRAVVTFKGQLDPETKMPTLKSDYLTTYNTGVAAREQAVKKDDETWKEFNTSQTTELQTRLHDILEEEENSDKEYLAEGESPPERIAKPKEEFSSASAYYSETIRKLIFSDRFSYADFVVANNALNALAANDPEAPDWHQEPIDIPGFLDNKLPDRAITGDHPDSIFYDKNTNTFRLRSLVAAPDAYTRQKELGREESTTAGYLYNDLVKHYGKDSPEELQGLFSVEEASIPASTVTKLISKLASNDALMSTTQGREIVQYFSQGIPDPEKIPPKYMQVLGSVYTGIMENSRENGDVNEYTDVFGEGNGEDLARGFAVDLYPDEETAQKQTVHYDDEGTIVGSNTDGGFGIEKLIVSQDNSVVFKTSDRGYRELRPDTVAYFAEHLSGAEKEKFGDFFEKTSSKYTDKDAKFESLDEAGEFLSVLSSNPELAERFVSTMKDYSASNLQKDVNRDSIAKNEAYYAKLREEEEKSQKRYSAESSTQSKPPIPGVNAPIITTRSTSKYAPKLPKPKGSTPASTVSTATEVPSVLKPSKTVSYNAQTGKAEIGAGIFTKDSPQATRAQQLTETLTKDPDRPQIFEKESNAALAGLAGGPQYYHAAGDYQASQTSFGASPAGVYGAQYVNPKDVYKSPLRFTEGKIDLDNPAKTVNDLSDYATRVLDKKVTDVAARDDLKIRIGNRVSEANSILQAIDRASDQDLDPETKSLAKIAVLTSLKSTIDSTGSLKDKKAAGNDDTILRQVIAETAPYIKNPEAVFGYSVQQRNTDYIGAINQAKAGTLKNSEGLEDAGFMFSPRVMTLNHNISTSLKQDAADNPYGYNESARQLRYGQIGQGITMGTLGILTQGENSPLNSNTTVDDVVDFSGNPAYQQMGQRAKENMESNALLLLKQNSIAHATLADRRAAADFTETLTAPVQGGAIAEMQGKFEAQNSRIIREAEKAETIENEKFPINAFSTLGIGLVADSVQSQGVINGFSTATNIPPKETRNLLEYQDDLSSLSADELAKKFPNVNKNQVSNVDAFESLLKKSGRKNSGMVDYYNSLTPGARVVFASTALKSAGLNPKASLVAQLKGKEDDLSPTILKVTALMSSGGQKYLTNRKNGVKNDEATTEAYTRDSNELANFYRTTRNDPRVVKAKAIRNNPEFGRAYVLGAITHAMNGITQTLADPRGGTSSVDLSILNKTDLAKMVLDTTKANFDSYLQQYPLQEL